MIEQSRRLAHASTAGEVVYDAEHFFDGYRADPAYALATLEAAARGGAETLVLCDTNGGTLPGDVAEVVARGPRERRRRRSASTRTTTRAARSRTRSPRCAAGAIQVQGTINGYGERCGNANLCSMIADLELKLGLRCLPEGHSGRLTEVSHFVAEVANLAPDEHLPVRRHSPRSPTRAGSTWRRCGATRRRYEHVDAGARSATRRASWCRELSGRGNVLSKAEELGLDRRARARRDVLEEIKELEAQGF